MGKKIPDPMRLEAIKRWLEGESRDGMSVKLKICQGAVSGIIKEAGKNDPQFYLLEKLP
jgi:hypothetical protein